MTLMPVSEFRVHTHEWDIIRHTVVWKFSPAALGFIWVNLKQDSEEDNDHTWLWAITVLLFMAVFYGVLLWLWSYRAGGLPVAPAAVDAANLSLRAGEGETLEIWPEIKNKCAVRLGGTVAHLWFEC